MAPTTTTSSTTTPAHAFDFDKSNPEYGMNVFLVVILVLVFVGCLAGLLFVDLGRKSTWLSCLGRFRRSNQGGEVVATKSGEMGTNSDSAGADAGDYGPMGGLPKIDGLTYSPMVTPQRSTETGLGDGVSNTCLAGVPSLERASGGCEKEDVEVMKSGHAPYHRVESMVDLALGDDRSGAPATMTDTTKQNAMARTRIDNIHQIKATSS